MKSLIYKDIVNLKQQGKVYAVMIVVWFGLGIIQKNPAFVGGLGCIMSMMITLSACAYDEQAGWDKYALTMPVSRRDLVLSKYCLFLLVMLVGCILTAVAYTALAADPREAVGEAGVFIGGGLLLADVMLPATFRYGTEKGRSVMIAFFVVVMLAGLIMEKLSVMPEINPQAVEAVVTAFPFITLALLPVSVFLSIRAYRGREF